MQFALISLIPGLIRNLQDSADPSLDSYGRTVERPTTLKTSERSSCALNPPTRVDIYCDLVILMSTVLSYMGLPLQLFGKVRSFLHRGNAVTSELIFLE